MSADKLSPFFRVDHQADGARVPEGASVSIDTTIAGMQPGEVTVPYGNAVWYDPDLDRHFVYTHANKCPDIPRPALSSRPLLYRAMGERTMDFIADFRMVDNYRRPWGTSHYDEDGDTDRYRRLEKTHGVRLIAASIFKTPDGPVYSGQPHLKQQAADFMQEVDSQLGYPSHVDSEPLAAEPAEETEDVHTWQVPGSFSRSPAGRAVYAATRAIGLASQRSADKSR